MVATGYSESTSSGGFNFRTADSGGASGKFLMSSGVAFISGSFVLKQVMQFMENPAI